MRSKTGFFVGTEKEKIQQEQKTKLNELCCSANGDAIKGYLDRCHVDVNYGQGTPLILAIRSIQVYPAPTPENYLNTLHVLVAAGADIHINEEDPLRWAMRLDSHAAVNYLLSLDTKFSIDASSVNEYLDRNPSLDEKLVYLLDNIKTSASEPGETPNLG